MTTHSGKLTVAVTSTALFDLREDSKIFEEQGAQAFFERQRTLENEIPAPGTALPLIQALLGLNNYIPNSINVVLVSKNSPDCGMRLSKATNQYQLNINQALFTSGEDIIDYLRVFNVDLFLSTDETDVARALANGIAAGRVHEPPIRIDQISVDQVRIAFDGDAVLVGDQADKISEEHGLDEFYLHETRRCNEPLPTGPMTNLLRKLNELQERLSEQGGHGLIRVGLFTARNYQVAQRMKLTLQHFQIRVDDAFFLDGVNKTPFLQFFSPQIFFDDKLHNTEKAADCLPTAHVVPGYFISPEA
jgi:5'-nucleotidase